MSAFNVRLSIQVVLAITLSLCAGVTSAKTRIVFLNGITNSKVDAYLSQVRLEEVIREYWAGSQLDSKEIVVKHFHNPTGGFAPDNKEMLHMAELTDRASECANSYSLSTYKDRYRVCLGNLYKRNFEAGAILGEIGYPSKVYTTLSALTLYIEGVLAQNEKIVVVAHSQGNYFAEALNAFVSTRQNLARFDANVRFVGVASVAPSTPNDQYITLEQDIALTSWTALKAVNGLNLPILTRNLDPCGGDTSCPGRLQASHPNIHSFVNIYMSDASEHLVFPIKKYVSDLVRDAYRTLNATVSDVQPIASPAGVSTIFTVTGTNLPASADLDIFFEGCTGIQILTRSSSQHTFSCVPQNAGPKTLELRLTSGGAILKSQAVTFSADFIGILNPANGYRYEVIECGSWSLCNSAATTRGGQLVTIRSASENAWLLSNFPTSNDFGYWIGLKRTGATWTWISGESSSFTNWEIGEPNSVPGDLQDYAHMYGRNVGTAVAGRWNDTTNLSQSTPRTTQAIVEYR